MYWSAYCIVTLSLLSCGLGKSIVHEPDANSATDSLEKPQVSIIRVPVGPATDLKWPNGKVHYNIDSSLDSNERENLKRAILDYHEKTCIRWIERKSEEAYVTFLRNKQGHRCADADKCYNGGRANVILEQCTDRATFIHEMGHTLCFRHEEDRYDKSNFISNCRQIGYDHINFGHLYDFQSIMHDECNNKTCLAPIVDAVSSSQCKSKDGLSVLDAEKLNDAYNCPGCHSYRFRFPFLLDSDSKLVDAGFDYTNRSNYICRAYLKGDIIPGKTNRESGNWKCWVGWGGSEHGLTNPEQFEILTNPNGAKLKWVSHNPIKIPAGAIPGGRTKNGETLYIARCKSVLYNSPLLTPGKIHADDPSKMHYTFDDLEYNNCTNIEILTCLTDSVLSITPLPFLYICLILVICIY